MRKLRNEELDRLSIDRFRESDKTPLTVILDDVRSLNNVGSVFRTADAYRIKKIYLCGITGCPPHRDIRKTALGASKSVDWEYREDVIAVIKELQDQGCIVAAIEQAENSTLLHDWQLEFDTEYAVILGNEVEGVSQKAVDAADKVVELEQYGTKHSLNISVCSGIVMYDLFHKLRARIQ